MYWVHVTSEAVHYPDPPMVIISLAFTAFCITAIIFEHNLQLTRKCESSNCTVPATHPPIRRNRDASSISLHARCHNDTHNRGGHWPVCTLMQTANTHATSHRFLRPEMSTAYIPNLKPDTVHDTHARRKNRAHVVDLVSNAS